MKALLRRLSRSRFLMVALALQFISIGTLAYGRAVSSPSEQSSTVTIASAPMPREAVQGVPVQIRIPDVGIDIKVELGDYDPAQNTWTLSGYNAHVATMMAPANDTAGNTFIYGHNNKDVFGPLKNIKPTTQAEIITDNGNRFFYTFSKASVVPPEDVSLFTYKGPPILTLQTCTGVWHEQRQLQIFTFSHVIESQSEIAERNAEQRTAIINAVSRPLISPASPLDYTTQ